MLRSRLRSFATTALATLQRGLFLSLVFVIPLALHYVAMEPFAISWLNLLSVVFIGLSLLALVTGVTPYRSLPHRPFWWLIGVLLATMAWALINTDPLRNGVGLWTSRLTQPLLVGFFAYQLYANHRLKLSAVTAALFWSLVPLIVVGGFQATGFIAYRDPGRITATYFYPNTAARYFVISLAVSLPWLMFALNFGRRWRLGVWLMGVALLLATKSYNGVVSLWVGLMTMVWLWPRSLRQLARVATFALVLIALTVAVNAPKLPKWHTSIQDSRLTRVEFWGVAVKVIRDNFWTGIGIKTWEKTYPQLVEKYGPFPPRNWGSVQPHNVFLDGFVRAGLPGFFATAVLMFWPLTEGIAYARLAWRARQPEWWFGLSCAAYGAAMLAFGLIDDPIWSDDTVPIYFIMAFLLAGAAVQGRRRPLKEVSDPR